jgi:hypothetical protein
MGNIDMGLGELAWGSMDWIHMTQYREQWKALVNMVMKLRVPRNAGNFLSSCKTYGILKRVHIHAVSQFVETKN